MPRHITNFLSSFKITYHETLINVHSYRFDAILRYIMCTKNLSYFLSGSVVRGFGRGSKALGIPTGKIKRFNFYLMNSEILKLRNYKFKIVLKII